MTMKQKAHTALASVVLASTFLLLAATLLHGTDFEASEAGLDNRERKVDLDVDANYDNEISIPAPDDPIEEDHGGIVVVGERDDIKIRLVPDSEVVTNKLEWTSNKIKVFEAETEVTSPYICLPPKTLSVRGEIVSDRPRDVSMTLTSIPPGAVDEITYTVLKVELDVDTDNDGTIDSDDTGEDEFEQYEPGVIVCKDRAGDGTDLDHLVEAKLKLEPSLTTGTLKLEASSGGSKIKIWTDAAKTSEVTLPETYDLDSETVPSSLWIDGVDEGKAVLDLYYTASGGTEICRDKVAVYVTKTVSWAPRATFSREGKASSWQPVAWSGNIGQGVTTHNTVLDNIKDEGWDITTHQYIDETYGDDDIGGCTLGNFKSLRYSPILAVSTHGSSSAFAGVYAASGSVIDSWIGSESGITKEWGDDASMYYAWVSSSWIEANWNMLGTNLDYWRSITMFMVCNGATGGDGSLVAKAGGRARFGYATSPSHSNMQSNNNKLFVRMNGTLESAGKRPAITAFDGGSGYADSLKMFGNGWSTLCPATVAVFPSGSPGTRKGWGCIIFDTYMDDMHATAATAITKLSGTCAVSNFRWISNGSGEYAIGFDFDNTGGGGATMRAHADKCRHMCGSTGLGRKLDGNAIKPNGDDRDWFF